MANTNLENATATPPVTTQTIPGVRTINPEDLKKLLALLQAGAATTAPQISSPFTAAVREAQLPTGFRNLNADLRYHGNADPREFLIRFNIEMDLYQIPDLVRCRFLVATLRDSAQQWFQKLEGGVISSWEGLQQMFMTQFQAATKYAPPVTTLANVKQRDNETLTAYFKRFNQESMGVKGASVETLKNFLIAGLKVGTDFWKHLQGKDPATLSELYSAAESFKKVEQSLAENQKEIAKSKYKRKDRTPSPEARGRARSPGRVNMTSSKRSWSPPRQSGIYTPLTASAEHIYAVSKDKVPFQRPQPIPQHIAKDKKKYVTSTNRPGIAPPSADI